MGTGAGTTARRGTASALLVVGAALAATVLTGCGAEVERVEAGRAGDTFIRAEATDPSLACDRLAPRTREAVEQNGASCPQTLADAGLPSAGHRREVTVAGHSAQVRYVGDTVFLALFDDGWRVTAAGCTRTSTDQAVPYDCVLDGG